MLVRLRVPSWLWLLVRRALQRLQRGARWMPGREQGLSSTLLRRHDRWVLRTLERRAFRRLVLWPLWRLVRRMLWRFWLPLRQDHSRRAVARWVLRWVLFRRLVRRVLLRLVLQMLRRFVLQVLRRFVLQVRWRLVCRALAMPVLLPLGRCCRTLHDVIHHDQSSRAVPGGIGAQARLNIRTRRLRRGLKQIVLDVDRIGIALDVATVTMAGPAAEHVCKARPGVGSILLREPMMGARVRLFSQQIRLIWQLWVREIPRI